jgi:hypothetical protein
MTSYPDGPNKPGWSNNDHGIGAGYFNSYLGSFDGPGNPNTNFNPDIGSYSNATTFTWGGGGNLASAPAAPMNNQNFSDWNWEEIVNNILGLKLPDRTEITAGRWTALLSDSAGTNSPFYIYGVTWGVQIVHHHRTSGHDTLIYLNPVLQNPGGPWDAYINGPKNAMWEPKAGFTTKHVTMDPTTFLPPVFALAGVEGMFANSVGRLTALSSALNSDASQFKGQAGQAFSQLIGDLLAQTSYASTQMGLPTSSTSYSLMLGNAGSQAAKFLTSVWNSYAAWTQIREHSPLGAILEALVVGNVVTVTFDEKAKQWVYQANPNLDPNDSQFGMLSTDQAWRNVETLAKSLWNAAIVSTLDYGSMAALNDLVLSYEQASQKMQPLRIKAPKQIGQPDTTGGPNNGGGFNPNNLNNDFSSIASMLANIDKGFAGGFNNLNKGFDGGFNNIGRFFPDLAKDIGGGFNNIDRGLGGLGQGLGGGLNNIDQGLGGLGQGLGGLGQGLGGNSTLSTPGGNQNLLSPATGQLSGFLPGAPAVTGGGSTDSQPNGVLGQPVTSALQDALTGANQTQGALDQALAGGQVPASGPLHDSVVGALADNAKTQAALNQAIANPSAQALDQAMADNSKTQTALNQALASGQIPSTGPLAAQLRSALAGTGRTQKALQQALAGGSPNASSLHTAMADNSQARAALDHALSSGQVPASGPLHQDLQHALADTGKTQSALTHALATGSPSASQLQTALADNSHTRAALERALASGQVPATGPLHTALRNALADTGKTSAAINHALVASVPGGAALQHAMTNDTALQHALHRAMASGQIPKVGALHDAMRTAMTDSGNVQNALRQAMAGGGHLSTAAIHRALTDNYALEHALHRALASGQIPAAGPLHADLTSALADSRKTGAALHQALASRGIASEPGASLLSGGPAALTGGLGAGLTSGKPLISAAAPAGGLTGTGLGSGAGGISAGGSVPGSLTGSAAGTGSASPVSSGAFVPQAAGSSTATAGEGGFPMYEPMAGGMGMGMGGMGGQNQERERTTWLSEDEDVWGTEPDVAPQVLGRDVSDEDDEASEYRDSDRDTSSARRTPTRFYGR